nr:ribonuclease H-like domain-containing protein [Tanacetum cinerariifolium]
MLADSKLPTTFWTEAFSTACYVQNRMLVIKPHNKTPYELFLGKERTQRNEFKSMFRQDKDANGNRIFTPVSAAGSTYVCRGGSILVNAATLLNADLPTDPLMPDLEDTADLQNTGIYSGVYDDEIEGLALQTKRMTKTS